MLLIAEQNLKPEDFVYTAAVFFYRSFMFSLIERNAYLLSKQIKRFELLVLRLVSTFLGVGMLPFQSCHAALQVEFQIIILLHPDNGKNA